MGSIDIFKPLLTFLRAVPLINLSNIDHIFEMIPDERRERKKETIIEICTFVSKCEPKPFMNTGPAVTCCGAQSLLTFADATNGNLMQAHPFTFDYDDFIC